MTRLHRLLPILCLSLLLPACGGGGGGTPKPVADAGTDQTVEMGSTVTLDASGSSTERDGATLSYTWTLVDKPDNSSAELSGTTTEEPSFVADLPGTYEADLVVSDGTEESSHDRVIVTATNPDPVAIAPTEHNVLIGTTVMLDGSASLPPTGGDPAALGYQWTLTEKPVGSTAVLAGGETAIAGFYADVAGAYTATLVVSYGEKRTEPLTVTITASTANTRPVANAGGPYTVERGKTLTLDGTGSSDADGDTLSYRWYLFSPNTASGLASIWSPNGSALRVDTAIVAYNTATPTITPDVVGRWSAYLAVYDGTTLSNLSTASITVTKPADAPNAPPVASTFGTPRVGFVAPVYISEAELSTTVWASGNSYDIDGDALTRRFRWVSTPEGYTPSDLSTAMSFSFTPTVPGDYTWEMIVNDGQVDSAPLQRTLTARTGANRAPTAAVSVDSQTILVGGTGWFDGSGSADMDGDQLTYHWTLLDRPDGSTAALQTADVTREDGTVLKGARASVVADQPGAYFAALVVTDGHGVTSAVNTLNYGRVLAKAGNNPPTASIAGVRSSGFSTNPLYPYWGMDESQPAYTGTLYYVIPSVVDPDLDTLYYLWTLDQQPEGSELPEAVTSANLGFQPQVPGTYQYTLVASDGVVTSEPQSVTVNVVSVDAYPSLKLRNVGYYTGSAVAAGSVPDLSSYNDTGKDTTTFPYVRTETSSQGLTDVFKLTGSGGDYTITDIAATTSWGGGGGQARIVGLSEGQVIKNGEVVYFAIVSPEGYSLADAVNGAATFAWSFKIKEREDWYFDYTYQYPRPQ